MKLKISRNSQKNTCVGGSFLTKFQACNFIKKETSTQMFSCEFFEMFRNTFFTEHLRMSASVKGNSKKWVKKMVSK